MEISFLDVALSVITLVLLMIPGALLTKCKMIGKGADSALSNIVLYGAQPLLLFLGFQKKPYDSTLGINMLITLGVTALSYALIILFVFLFYKEKSEKAKVLRYASIFGNCGFMGVPFLQMLFRENEALMGEALIYCSIILAVFNIVNWTAGVVIMTGDKKKISVKKIFLNPNIIAIILGFIVFIAFKKPLVELAVEKSVLDQVISSVVGAMDSIASLVTPLSMIVVGYKLANVKPKRLFTDKHAYFTSFNKLFILSLISIIIAILVPVSDTVKAVLFFMSAMPSAASTTLFATTFNADADTASVMVLQSTILSILTIPLMYLLYSNVVPYLSGLIYGVI